MSTPLKTSAQALGRTSLWREHRETGPLSAVVEATWEGSGGWGRTIRLLPDGCADIVWDGDRLTLTPPRRTALRRRVADRTLNVGLRLRCGAFGGLMGVGVADDADAPLRLLWGRLAEAAETRLRRARDPGRGREILLDLVGERWAAMAATERPPEAMIEALRTQTSTVEALAEHHGWTGRDLRRAFQRHVGLSPKSLQGVFRFRRLLDGLAGETPAAQLAAELGYADQAHMTRDCRATCGSSPGRLRLRLRD